MHKDVVILIQQWRNELEDTTHVATTKECNRICMQWAKMKKLVLLMFHKKRPLLMYHKKILVMMLQKCCNNGLDESLYEKWTWRIKLKLVWKSECKGSMKG